MDLQKIKLRLDNGEEVYMEAEMDSNQIERGVGQRIYNVSNDYLKVAKNIVQNLRNIDLSPDELELEFGIKLSVGSGDFVSWIVTDVNAEASIRVKMKWKDDSPRG